MVLGRTKGKATAQQGQVIVIHDSDSEADSEVRHFKRQRTTDSSQLKPIAGSSSYSGDMKNTHLRGRKRFAADFEDLKEETSKHPLQVHGLRVQSLQAGDDEGSIEIRVLEVELGRVIGINLLVSDTSEYPKEHSFFSYVTEDVPEKIQDALNEMASAPPRTIRGALAHLFSTFAEKPVPLDVDNPSDEEEDESADEDFGMYDDFEDFGTSSTKSNFDRAKLQRDFLEVVGAEFRPGMLKFGADDFCLSVSIPVVTLSNSIPAQALMAWDRRLLSRTQHLVLLVSGNRGIYPTVSKDGAYTSTAKSASVQLKFQVGLSGQYKPSEVNAKEAVRKYGLVVNDAEDELRIQAEKEAAEAIYGLDAEEGDMNILPLPMMAPAEEDADEGRFEKFSLSSSFESLLDQNFLKLVQLRRKFGLGWAGAELLHALTERRQMSPEDVYQCEWMHFQEADEAEQALDRSLPLDPLRSVSKDEDINLLLTSFSYLVRRITLCTRYCVICHNKLETDFEALKPYVCDSKLCAYQYYTHNRGLSLEYEILHNPLTVDLLVSMTYSAAAEGVLDEPLPVGMGLWVPLPSQGSLVAPPVQRNYLMPGLPGFAGPSPIAPTPQRRNLQPDNRGLVDFDALDEQQMRAAITSLLASIPAIDNMKKHLERKVKPGKSKPKLQEVDPNVLPAAWSVLRWCIASCTAYLEPMAPDENIVGLDATWRQFRFTVGAPDMEAKFKGAVAAAQQKNSHARKYPSLYAFHGSAFRNWHSIIRHGLWAKYVAHGRAYGNGVYLAKDATLSMGTYAGGTLQHWAQSRLSPSACVAVVETVNLPSEFVSCQPFFVVNETSWLFCRYLLVKCAAPSDAPAAPTGQIPFVQLDPTHFPSYGKQPVQIPQPGYKINMVLASRRGELIDEDPDIVDAGVFGYVEQANGTKGNSVDVDEEEDNDYDYDYDDEVAKSPVASSSKGEEKATVVQLDDDWAHDSSWVAGAVGRRMPPPDESTPSATMAVQRELKAMLKEQKAARSLKELGWYLPEEFIDDNLFSWIVEMHSFDETIPVAKDMKAKGINSVIFEIRFPAAFPLQPPFFRILTPRFLPFIHGGGGHVTGGGSICMDLLTSDGWLPSYSMPAIIMQIKLAISNLDPRPARLAADWDRDYQVGEALVGYKRAAATHGWQVPVGIEKLVS